MDLGQDRRGVDMGPSAIRYARIEPCLEDLGHKVTDLGNAVVPIPETVTAGEEVKHLSPVMSVCEEVSERAATIVSEGMFPIFLGGDHSIAIGTVSAGDPNGARPSRSRRDRRSLGERQDRGRRDHRVALRGCGREALAA
jgi:arginase